MLSLNVPKNVLTVTKTLICNKKKKNPQKQSLHCDYSFFTFLRRVERKCKQDKGKLHEQNLCLAFCMSVCLFLSPNEYLERRYSLIYVYSC